VDELTREMHSTAWSASRTLFERLIQEQQRLTLVVAALEVQVKEARSTIEELEDLVSKPGPRPNLLEHVQDLAHQLKGIAAQLEATRTQRVAHTQGRWQLWTALVSALVALLLGLLPYLLQPASARRGAPDSSIATPKGH